MRAHLQKGANLRMMFKVGKLVSRAGELHWKSHNEESSQANNRLNCSQSRNDQANELADDISKFSKTTYGSRITVGSVKKRDLSVITPSICKTKFTSTNQPSTFNSIFHPSNPNPQQNKQVKFKGVRDLGYSTYERLMDPTDVIKFGKKVSYENKMTNMQVMEEHLKQMRSNFTMNKAMHDI